MNAENRVWEVSVTGSSTKKSCVYKGGFANPCRHTTSYEARGPLRTWRLVPVTQSNSFWLLTNPYNLLHLNTPSTADANLLSPSCNIKHQTRGNGGWLYWCPNLQGSSFEPDNDTAGSFCYVYFSAYLTLENECDRESNSPRTNTLKRFSSWMSVEVVCVWEVAPGLWTRMFPV